MPYFARPAWRRLAVALLATGALAQAFGVAAQTPPPPVLAPVVAAPGQTTGTLYGRWQSSFDGFMAADKEHLPERNGILFVGSSTIRLWTNLAQDFRDQPVVINRGFGGSTMADCEKFARDLVIKYQPRQVLVYAGDNDLAEGRSPEQVRQSFVNFVKEVRAELPDARITFISIKPSPSRIALMSKIKESNALIGAYVATLPNAAYIDIHTPMLAADGTPRAELFRGDQLHLNDAGYKLWQGIIAANLRGPGTSTDPAGLSARVTPRETSASVVGPVKP